MEAAITERPTLAQARQFNDQFAAAAQAIYDDWDESDIATYGGGGICHLIADALSAECAKHGLEAASVFCDAEHHAYVICQLADGVFSLDIPYSLYEIGSMFTWTKIHGVRFTAAAISWFRIDGNPENYPQYVDEY